MSGGFLVGLVYKKGKALFLAYEKDGLLYFKNGLFFKKRAYKPGSYSLIDPRREFGVDGLLAHWGATVVEFDKVCARLFRHQEVRDSRPAGANCENRDLRFYKVHLSQFPCKKSVEIGEVLYFMGSARDDCPESFIGGSPGYMKAKTA